MSFPFEAFFLLILLRIQAVSRRQSILENRAYLDFGLVSARLQPLKLQGRDCNV